MLLFLFSVQIHETAYQRAARELAAVKKELVELKVTISLGGFSYEKVGDPQLFLRILTAHGCERKFTCHIMHRARAPSTKMNNDRADGHCYSFAWI